MRVAAALVAVAAVVFVVNVDAAGAHHCVDRECVRLKAGWPACRTLQRERGWGWQRVAVCEIDRAARHHGVGRYYLRSVSWCESGHRWWISGAYQGQYQYLVSSWYSMPHSYRRVGNPWNAKWASLATAQLLRRGWSRAWPNCA
jgi:hypothetical protein